MTIHLAVKLRAIMKNRVVSVLRSKGKQIGIYSGRSASPIALLELVVRAGLFDRSEVSFIQIGANDGTRDDPLFSLVRSYRLRGLLVEPLPDMFASLVQNYAEVPGLRFERAALAKENGTVAIHRVKRDSNVPDWLHGSASLDRQLLTRHAVDVPGLENLIESLEVPAMTFDELLARHQIKSCDLLVIDTEGYDAVVIEMMLESRLRPAYIYYEHVNLSPDTIDKVIESLTSEGYGFVTAGINTLAARIPPASPH